MSLPGNWDEETRPGFCSPLSAILSNCSVVRLFYSEKPVHWEFVVHQQRAILSREIQGVETEYGMVRVKVAWSGKEEERAIANAARI